MSRARELDETKSSLMNDDGTPMWRGNHLEVKRCESYAKTKLELELELRRDYSPTPEASSGTNWQEGGVTRTR